MNFYCDLCLNTKDDNNTNNNNANFNELISCALLDNYQILGINITKKINYIDEKNYKTISSKKNNSTELNQNVIQDLYTKNSLKFLNSKKSELINWSKIKTLSRLTLEISEQKDIFLITKATNILKNFDLFVIKPKNDKILENILMSEIGCDMINLDLYEKFNFMSKKKLFQTNIEKGVFFEIEYGKFITDNESRNTYISNFILLNNILKGKNLIISSGAETFFEQRNPEDVITILETIFDIKKDIGFKMMTENPIKALLKGKQRKLYKTTLDIMKDDD